MLIGEHYIQHILYNTQTFSYFGSEPLDVTSAEVCVWGALLMRLLRLSPWTPCFPSTEGATLGLWAPWASWENRLAQVSSETCWLSLSFSRASLCSSRCLSKRKVFKIKSHSGKESPFSWDKFSSNASSQSKFTL